MTASRTVYREEFLINYKWTCDTSRRPHLRSRQRKLVGKTITIGETSVAVIPKYLTLYPSAGWLWNVTHVLNWFLYNEIQDLSNEKRAKIILQVLGHMNANKGEWNFNMEDKPLWYMGYLMQLVQHFSGIYLKTMGGYTQLIKVGSYYHMSVWKLKQLWECPHLMNLDFLRQDQLPPSVTSLKTHKATFEVARKTPDMEQEAFEKARNHYALQLQLHGKKHLAAAIKSILGLDIKPPTTSPSAVGDNNRLSTASSQANTPSSDSSSKTEEEYDPNQTSLMEVVPSLQRGGDIHSLGDWVDEEEAWGTEGSCHYSNKRRHEVSEPRSFYSGSIAPFPRYDEARCNTCDWLFKEAKTSTEEHSKWIYMILRHRLYTTTYKDIDVVHLTNLLLVTVAKFHLTRTLWHCGPMILLEIEK